MRKIFFGMVIVLAMLLTIHQMLTLSGYEQLIQSVRWDQKKEMNSSSYTSTKILLNNLEIQSLPFISQIKNPCWFSEDPQKNGSQLKCLPYFFVAGLPKCATTDIYYRILEHQDVLPATIKEPQWWSRNRFKKGGTWNSYLKMFTLSQQLQDQCELKSLSHAQNVSSSCQQIITGDATPSTFWDMGQTMWELKRVETERNSPNASLLIHLLENSQLNSSLKTKSFGDSNYYKYTIADLIHQVLPKARFIVMMRNPVERLYSEYRYFKRSLPKNEKNFDSSVKNSMNVWNDCVAKHSVRFCVYDPITIASVELRLQIGIYLIYVEDWLKVFPRNQILFIRTENYESDLDVTMKRVYRHLDLRPLEENLERSKTKKWKLQNVSRTKLNSMLPETRRILREFYSPFNRELARILEDKRFLWLD